MPEDKKRFDLGDYIEVKERIKIFYELYAQGRLVTGEVRLSNEPDGVPRVLVQGLAYRSPEDTLPGVGWSWMVLPGTTSYTRGSELENAETSAWGRAIASLGILIDRSIASAQEVQNKQDDGTAQVGPTRPATPPPTPNVETEELIGELKPPRTGTVKSGGGAGYKLEARQGPDGHVIGFSLETKDGNIPQVVASGPLGEALYIATGMNPARLIGERVTLKGRLFMVKRPGTRGYYRLHLTGIETNDYILPAPDEPKLPEPPADVRLIGEEEAATAPLFDDVA